MSMNDTRDMKTTFGESYKIGAVHDAFAKKESALRGLLERAWIQEIE